MKLTVLHLSDIHIKKAEDLVLSRAQNIAETTYKFLPDTDAVLLLFSGDIAFSGKEDEYDLAEQFVNDIMSNISKETKKPIHIIVVPGNHDCNFEGQSSVRDAVLSTLTNLDEDSIDDDLIGVCLSVQKNFIGFRNRISTAIEKDSDPLWGQYIIEIEDKKVLIDCLNMAWMSQKNEQQGVINFPLKRYQKRAISDENLRIITFHHPVNWLKQGAYQSLRTFLRTIGDLIITGHEHTQSTSLIDDAVNTQSVFIEGAALQSDYVDGPTGFNVIDIDLSASKFKSEMFEWNGTEYEDVDLVGSWASFKKLPERHPNEFVINSEYCGSLRDPGASFSHPAKQLLELTDFYIYPDLEELTDNGGKKSFVNASILKDFSNLKSGVVIKGEEKSGKTSMLHMLYLCYHNQGKVPVYLNAQKISQVSGRELQRSIETALTEQYCDKAIGKWNRLEKKNKILILDDFDRSRVADQYRWKILEYAKSSFGNVLVIVDDIVELSEVTSIDMSNQMAGFQHYEIQPFGYKLRYELIKKWGGIGDDFELSSSDLIAKVDQAEKIVNTVLGKNLIPRVPIFLLTLLQSLETSNSVDIKNSGFGHYYQYLITRSLGKVNVDIGELDEFFNYCSQLAWYFHSSKLKEHEYNNIREFNRVYSDEYVDVECEKRLEKLCDARILTKRGPYYSFSYPYVYFFFLGKYISDNLAENQELRDLIERCCDHLYLRENSNIVLFTSHHKKDQVIIDSILRNLRGLFPNTAPVLFNGDTTSFNDLAENTSRLIYSGGDPDHHRKKSGELKDKLEKLEDDEDEKIECNNELDLPSKLNKLFKTIDILGQILKSYYGSITKNRKKELMKDMYEGPLRALRDFFVYIESDKEAFLHEIETLIEAKNKNLDKNQRGNLAKKLVFWIVRLVAFSFIYKVASATSSKNLRDVSKELLDENDNVSFRLIDLASRLDLADPLPFAEIEAISNETDNDVLSHRLLETIVLRHLYFFKVKEADRQKICEILGISVKGQRKREIAVSGKKLTH